MDGVTVNGKGGEWLGWHWLASTRRLQYPPCTIVEPGQTLTVPGPLCLCRHGLHASRHALDALKYAPGAIVCRVRLSGVILEGGDKACATERTCLWLADATTVLHEFACWVAEQALTRERAQGRESDPRSWTAIEAKRQWLRGEIGDEQLAAAREAAWDAGREAAKVAKTTQAALYAACAAREAASASAREAAREAAWADREAASASAREAAREATWVAREATWNATWDAQDTELERRLMALAPGTNAGVTNAGAGTSAKEMGE